MNEYFYNAFYWWYMIKVKEYFLFVRRRYLFMLNRTDSLPMARNMFRPMFGDETKMGYMIGIFIRIWWVSIGVTLSSFLIIPYILFGVFLFLLPLIPFIQLFRMIFL